MPFVLTRWTACVAIGALACAGGVEPKDDTAPAADTDADTDLAIAAPHPLGNTCLEYAAIAAALVPWDTLANPLISRPDESLSDVSVRFTVGRWHLFASRRVVATGHRDVLHLVSTDMKRWDEAGAIDAPDGTGLVSPDVTRDDDGRFMLTAATVTDPRPLVWWSDDLGRWSEPQVVEAGTADPVITLAHANVGLVALATRADTIAISRTRRVDSGWSLQRVHLPLGLARFLRVDDAWHVLGTGPDGPALVALAGADVFMPDWRAWADPRSLGVPPEAWNVGVTASGATLCDARGIDGFAYLYYAGSDGADFAAGHGAIGLARSRDLMAWETPPGP